MERANKKTSVTLKVRSHKILMSAERHIFHHCHRLCNNHTGCMVEPPSCYVTECVIHVLYMYHAQLLRHPKKPGKE